MTADDILALNTILEVRPFGPMWDGFLAVMVSLVAVAIGCGVATMMWGTKNDSVRKLGFAPLAAAAVFAMSVIPSGFAAGAETRAAQVEWEARLERTGSCGRLAAAVEAGRVRWLDGPAYRRFAERCGRDVSIAAANAEGVDFTVGEVDARRGW